jgi:hypothetical protein
MSSNVILTCDICELSFHTRGSYREQKESLRVTRPRSVLPRRSCHNSGDSRRPNPLASETPVIPID